MAEKALRRGLGRGDGGDRRLGGIKILARENEFRWREAAPSDEAHGRRGTDRGGKSLVTRATPDDGVNKEWPSSSVKETRANPPAA